MAHEKFGEARRGILKIAAPALLCFCAAAGWTAGPVAAQVTSFQPGQVWLDADGNVIQAHDGGILYHQGVYYWYGSDYAFSGAGTFIGIRCYSSTDLFNWTYEGYALQANAAIPDLSPTMANSRAHVLYNATTHKFVMWLHVDTLSGFNTTGSRAGVAVSDTPAGPFQYQGSFDPINWPDGPVVNGGYRDDNIFMDDDGKAYVFYASESNTTMYVARLSADYLDIERPIVENQTWARILINHNREAPAPFKFNGRYHLITSGCTGWTPNAADWAVSTTGPLGPYVSQGNPCVGANSGTTFESQSTCVFPMPDRPGSFIFMADRWNAGNLGDSRYIWLPLQMESDNTFELNWTAQWDLSVFPAPAPPPSPITAASSHDSKIGWGRLRCGSFGIDLLSPLGLIWLLRRRRRKIMLGR